MFAASYDRNSKTTATSSSSATFTSGGFYKTDDIVRVVPANKEEEADSTPPLDVTKPQHDAPVTIDVLGRTGSSIKLSTGK